MTFLQQELHLHRKLVKIVPEQSQVIHHMMVYLVTRVMQLELSNIVSLLLIKIKQMSTSGL